MSDDILASPEPTPYDINDTSMIRINQSTVLSTDNVSVTPIFRTYTVVYGNNVENNSCEQAVGGATTHSDNQTSPMGETDHLETLQSTESASEITESIPETSDPEVDFSLHDGTLVADIQDIFPVICFLDQWLRVVKDQEWTYDYKQPK